MLHSINLLPQHQSEMKMDQEQGGCPERPAPLWSCHCTHAQKHYTLVSGTPVGRSFSAVGEITLLEWEISNSCHHPISIRTEQLTLPLTWTNSKWYWWNGFMCSRGTLYSVSNSLLGWSAISSITTAGKKQSLVICGAKFCLKNQQDCRVSCKQ